MNFKTIVSAGLASCFMGCLGDRTALVEPSRETSRAAQSAAAACPDPEWDAATAYPTGSKVSRSGNTYAAKWWTQGSDPASHSGAWDVWSLTGPCGDAVAPVVSFLAPARLEFFYQATPANPPIDVRVAVNSDQVPIDSIQFTIQEFSLPGLGRSYFTNFTKFSPPYDFKYQPISYHSGANAVIYAVAYSKNVASERASTQFYPHSLPVVTVESPADNAVLPASATTVAVDVSVNSNYMQIDSVVYDVTDFKAQGGIETSSQRKFVVASPYDLNLPVQPGSAYSVIVATSYGISDYVPMANGETERPDGLSRKKSESKTIRVNYAGSVGPVIAITSPMPKFNNNNAVYTVGSSLTVAADVAGGSPIAKVEISLGQSGRTVTKTAPPYTATFEDLPAPAPDGSIFFTVRAYDAEGKSSEALVVAYKNRAPNIAVTSPHEGDTFAPGSTVDVTTFTSDADGAIAKVEFFDGGVKIGESAAMPFTFPIAGAAAGPHALTAKVTDDLGASSTTPAITFVVSGNKCAAPAWKAETAYAGGDQVSKDRAIYQAKWWSRGEDPALRSGAGDVWERIGACAGM